MSISKLPKLVLPATFALLGGACFVQPEPYPWDTSTTATGGTTSTGGSTWAGGGGTTTTGTGGVIPCLPSGECLDDGNVCTKQECVGGLCEYSPDQTMLNMPCGDPAECANGMAKAQGTCNTNGACSGDDTKSCAPYVDCNGMVCADSCVDESGCTDGNYCDVNKKCAPKLAGGEWCPSGAACTSGFCVDSVCCDTACDGECQSCRLGGALPGVCSALPKGEIDACKADEVCDSGTCKPDGGLGGIAEACANDDDTKCYNNDGAGGANDCAAGLCRLGNGQPCDLDKPEHCMSNRCDPATHTCASCSNNDALCPGTMICQNNNRCELPTGSVCGANSTCLDSDECVRGRCRTKLGGVCNENAPAFLCSANRCVGGVCETCGVGDDCGVGTCQGGSCLVLPVGELCGKDPVSGSSDCVNCVNGLCRLGAGVSCTGKPAAYCNTNRCTLQGQCAPCTQDSDCPGTNACNENTGHCYLAAGEVCGAGIDCLSGDCTRGLCRLPTGAFCDPAKPEGCRSNLCDPITHTCKECSSNSDCPVMACDMTEKRCFLGMGDVCGTAADCTSHNCQNHVCQ